MWVGSERSTLCASASEESDSLVNNTPLKGYEPKFFDDYHFSGTTEIFIQESSSDSRPSNLHDSEISDYTIGRELSSPLFTQEREDPASRRQAYHSPHKGFLVQSVVVRRSCKNGETRWWVWITNPKRQIKSANQDSSGTTKRAGSRRL